MDGHGLLKTMKKGDMNDIDTTIPLHTNNSIIRLYTIQKNMYLYQLWTQRSL